MNEPSTSLWDARLLRPALLDSVKKLDPRFMWKNPVMFVTEIGAAVCSVVVIEDIVAGHFSLFNLQITLWLWFTVLFANLAEALAEGRGKAQAASLRKARTQTPARRLRDGREEKVAATDLAKGDLVVCEQSDVIPADGEVIEGIASVDEAAITGESAPVIRESGGDRSAVTGGTRVLSDRIVIRITCAAGDTFLDRMIAMVEGASRQKTPNEIALGILLVSMTAVFGLAVFTLPMFALYNERAANQPGAAQLSAPILVSLLVCLIPTTIGGLLGAIGISGIDRLIRRKVMATSGRAVEAAGDIDVLLLDKTGTITFGNRMASEFIPAPGITVERLAEAAQLASFADETPEGRSIVALASERLKLSGPLKSPSQAVFVPFTAQTRMSGVDLPGVNNNTIRVLRKGAAESIRRYAENQGGQFPEAVRQAVDEVSRAGGTPLVVVEGFEILGTVRLKDVVKSGIKERFAQLRKMGIRTVMITGDNPLTAAAIAAEAGVDDFMAQATPEDKLRRIREEQAAGHLVAMTGDGTNDAPALAQADVGVAMGAGTQAAREAGNMVDLDSNPTKLIEIVGIGKQLLMTRGALTTFSIANDVAKYFAILPAMFLGLYALPGKPSPLSPFNIMHLASAQSAILSAVIFNALIIVALIPLALRGVAYRPVGAAALLRRNLLIYGLGGLLVPFAGIKLVDMAIHALHLA